MSKVSIYQIKEGQQIMESVSITDTLPGHLANNYYTKTETANLITRKTGAVSKFELIIVNELPSDPEEINMTAIYLVPGTIRGANNLYTEYVWNYNENEWEILGTQVLDLDKYLEKTVAAQMYLGKLDKAISAEAADRAAIADVATIANSIINRQFRTVSGVYSSEPANFDGTGDANIPLPNILVADLKGNADSADTALVAAEAVHATKATTADAATKVTEISLTISDYDNSHQGEQIKISGGDIKTMSMPDTIKAVSFLGNSSSTDKLKTAIKLKINGTGSSNAATGVSFDGSGDATLLLPTTLGVNITGSAVSATKAVNDENDERISTTYAKVSELPLSYCTKDERQEILNLISALTARVQAIEDKGILYG